MLLKKLKLTNFRNYHGAEIALKSRTSLFIGPNGQGKTNLLEAISYLIQGQPVRYSRKDDLVNKDSAENFMRVDGVIELGETPYELSATIIGGKVSHKINNKAASSGRLRELFNLILFSPESLSVIKWGPQE